MIKLQDFAHECGITDRQVQRLLKKNEEALKGHFERKGSKGTWLDEEACELLRSKMKTNPVVLSDGAEYREKLRLQQENDELIRENKDLYKVIADLRDELLRVNLEKADVEKQLIEADNNKLLLEQTQTELESFKPVGLGFYRKKV